jgi:hypothetical protein
VLLFPSSLRLAARRRSVRKRVRDVLTIGIVLSGWLAAVYFFVTLCLAAKRGERDDVSRERDPAAQVRPSTVVR